MSWVSVAKRAFVLLSFLSLFFVDVLATTPAKIIKKEVKLQKVLEKTYDKLIKDIAFDKAIIDGEVQVYPKVIVFGDEVQFLDEKSEIVSRKSLVVTKPKEVGKYFGKNAILSRKGNFVAIHEYIGKYGDSMDYFTDEEFIICNDKGQEIFRVKGPVKGMGSADQWLISDKDGSVIGTRFGYGAIDFYIPDGSMKTVPFFGELGWGRSNGGVASFSGDGEYLAVLVRKAEELIRRMPSLKADVWVMLFDKSGNELWRRKVEEYRYGNITISEHGDYLAFKAFTIERETSGKKGKILRKKGDLRLLTSVTLGLYDKERKVLSLKDTSLYIFNLFCFSPKADYLAMAGDNIIRLMSTKDGSIVFEKELQPNNVSIRQLLFSEDGKYLIARGRVPISGEKVPELGGAARRVYTNLIFILNMKGEQVWQKDSSDLKNVSYLGKSLIFTFPQRYEVYREN